MIQLLNTGQTDSSQDESSNHIGSKAIARQPESVQMMTSLSPNGMSVTEGLTLQEGKPMNTNFNFTDGLMIVFLSTGLQLGCVVDNPGADAGMDSANDTSIVSAMLDAGMEDRDAGQTVDAGRTDIADQMIPHDVSIPPLDASP